MSVENPGFSLEQVAAKRASLEEKLQAVTAKLGTVWDELLQDVQLPDDPLTGALITAHRRLHFRYRNWVDILGKWIYPLTAFEADSRVVEQLPRLTAIAGELKKVELQGALGFSNQVTGRLDELTPQIAPLFDKTAKLPVTSVLPEPVFRPVVPVEPVTPSFIPSVQVDVQDVMFEGDHRGARIDGAWVRGNFGLCLARAISLYGQGQELQRDQVLQILPDKLKADTSNYMRRVGEYLENLGIVVNIKRGGHDRIDSLVFPETPQVQDTGRAIEYEGVVIQEDKGVVIINGIRFALPIDRHVLPDLIEQTYQKTDQAGKPIFYPRAEVVRIITSYAQKNSQSTKPGTILSRAKQYVDGLGERLHPAGLDVATAIFKGRGYFRVIDLISPDVKKKPQEPPEPLPETSLED